MTRLNEGSLNRRLHTTVHLLRHFGPGWLLFRAGYELRKRSGALRRALPSTPWEALPLAGFLSEATFGDPDRYAFERAQRGTSFFFSEANRRTFVPLFAEWDAASRTSPCVPADALCDGVFRFFEHRELWLGRPPDWHRHPLTNIRYPDNVHWSKIGDFGAGDLKHVWEPCRFAWVYPLVRAYWRTEDERYPQLFWELVESWRAGNPPQQGVHWKCGQEIALRIMACCFGLYGFAGSAASTAARIADLAQMMAVSGQRIESNLDYALSQKNNHGLVEAAGVWTLGLLFPEFAAAARWVRLGRECLERQCRDLIDDDGAFSQHSVNYQRVMLHSCLWAIRLGDLNGQPLSDELRDRVGQAGRFLWQLQDEATGRAPRYGANDGALVLPLTNCRFDDYRPVVQSSEWLRRKRRLFARGPWDEESLWLLGAESIQAEEVGEVRSDWCARQSGYCVLRGANGHVFTRTGAFRHRPSHADLLHVDVWWRGENIALDPGTYTYNAPPPWDSPLARTAFHNTVTVDGLDQMDRAGRFLWLPWINGRHTHGIATADGRLTYWEGMHAGYERLSSPVTYCRGILRIGPEHWLIVDRLSSVTPHIYRLHWLLIDAPRVFDEPRQHLRLETGAGPWDVCVASSADFSSTIVRADPLGPRGWYAPTYGDRRPAVSWAAVTEARAVTFWTLLGPSVVELHSEADGLRIVTADWTGRIHGGTTWKTGDPLLQTVRLDGSLTGTFVLPAAGGREQSSTGSRTAPVRSCGSASAVDRGRSVRAPREAFRCSSE